MPTQTSIQLNHETAALIEEEIRHLLEIMGFNLIKVSCTHKLAVNNQDETRHALSISIDAGDAGRILIGTHGRHLDCLQHIVRTIIRHKVSQPLYVNVDVNGYLASREQTLLHLAEEAARKAGKTGRAIVLPPMCAAERHTIHTSLSSRRGINTESLGDEPNRRVVVRPVFI